MQVIRFVDDADDFAGRTVRQAAEAGEEIPEGWALDAAGEPTTDPQAAMKGALLAFGGNRGANLALMVEVLAAGLSGANWSLDAPPFDRGVLGPATGLFILAIEPNLLEADFEQHIARHLDRLRRQYGVHIPGSKGAEAARKAATHGISVPTDIVRHVSEFAARHSS